MEEIRLKHIDISWKKLQPRPLLEGQSTRGRNVRKGLLQIEHNPPLPLPCTTHQVRGAGRRVRNGEEELSLGRRSDVGESVLICSSAPKSTLIDWGEKKSHLKLSLFYLWSQLASDHTWDFSFCYTVLLRSRMREYRGHLCWTGQLSQFNLPLPWIKLSSVLLHTIYLEKNRFNMSFI